MNPLKTNIARISKALVAVVAVNVNLLACLAGFAVLYVGVAGLSGPVANIVAGALVMAGSLWPYLRTNRRS